MLNSVLKKKRNRNRINPGDLFAFRLDDTRFGFGRIVSRIQIGHVAEIFVYVSGKPELPAHRIQQTHFPPLILDAYGLFQRKTEGDWGFIGETPNYAPSPEVAKVRFAWGLKGNQKATDIHDQSNEVTDAEAEKMPRFNPYGDWDVKEYLRKRGVVIPDD